MKEFDVKELLDEEVEVEELSFLQRVVCVFTDPKRAFSSMRNNPKILRALAIIILAGVGSILLTIADGSMKEQIIGQLQAAGQPVTDSAINMAIGAGAVIGAIGVIGIPFLIALIYHVCAMIQSKTGYKKTLAIYLHSQFIVVLGSIIVTVITMATGKVIQFSPAMFMDPNQVSSTLYLIASLFNVFTIWGLFVLFTGFKETHGMTTKEAIITIAIPAILGIVLIFVSTNMVAV